MRQVPFLARTHIDFTTLGVGMSIELSGYRRIVMDLHVIHIHHQSSKRLEHSLILVLTLFKNNFKIHDIVKLPIWISLQKRIPGRTSDARLVCLQEQVGGFDLWKFGIS